MATSGQTPVIKAFGLLSMLAATYYIYSAISNISFDSTITPLLLLISGYGLLMNKHWARAWFLFTTYLALAGITAALFITGPYARELHFLTLYAVFGIAIWYFNRKEVRSKFIFPKGKYLTAGGIVIVLLTSAFHGYALIENGVYKLPKLEHVSIEPVSKFDYSGYETVSLPLIDYSVNIPADFSLILVDDSEFDGKYALFMNSGKTIIDLREHTKLQEMYNLLPDKAYADQYSFADKYFNERFGYFITTLRDIYDSIYSVEQAKVNGMDIFIEHWREHGRHGVSFYLFRDGAATGGGTIVVSDAGELSDEKIRAIIASIKPGTGHTLSAAQYYTDGVSLFDSGETEKAKLALASAILLDPGKPEYHYLMGRAYDNTGKWSSAKACINEAIKLDPSNEVYRNYLAELMAKKKTKA